MKWDREKCSGCPALKVYLRHLKFARDWARKNKDRHNKTQLKSYYKRRAALKENIEQKSN